MPPRHGICRDTVTASCAWAIGVPNQNIKFVFISALTNQHRCIILPGDLAGTVASITAGDPGVAVKNPPTTPLVDRDRAPRRAGRLEVPSDVGALWLRWSSVRNR